MSFDRGLFERDIPRSLSRDGLSVDVPDGWEARIRRSVAAEEDASTFPVIHAATVPLSGKVADYGGGVVEKLGSDDVFISLIEFGDEAIGSALFAEVGEVPTLHASMFHPNQLQRRLRGQAGTQIFFTFRGRAFCLYVVIGAYSRRAHLANRAGQVIRSLAIEARQ